MRLDIIFLTGCLCFVYGLGFSHIEQAFTLTTVFACLIGVFCLGVCFFNMKKSMNILGVGHCVKRICKRAIYIVLLIGGVITMNMLAVKYELRLDVTANKQHTLSDETQKLLKHLDKEMTFTVLYTGITPKYVDDLLREYERLSAGKITTKIIDPLINIGVAAQFGSTIKSGDKKVIVETVEDNILRNDVDFTKSDLTEDKLNHAIIQMTREKRMVCFVTGHGENRIDDEEGRGFQKFSLLLAENNIVSKSLLLLDQKAIEKNCDALVIAGPTEHFTIEEKMSVQNYLAAGGDAVFLIEHMLVTTKDKPLTVLEKSKNPDLNYILNQWGVKVNRDVVVDLKNHVGSDVGSPATRNYMDHPALVGGLDYTFYIRPRSMDKLPRLRKTLKVVPIVLTESKEKSWAETNRTLNIKYDEYLDRQGPVPISFVIWEAAADENDSDTKIIVFTDSDFLSNDYLDYYSNAGMGINIIKWVMTLDYPSYEGVSDENIVHLDLTSRQKRMVAVVLVIIPFMIAMLGIGHWMRFYGKST